MTTKMIMKLRRFLDEGFYPSSFAVGQATCFLRSTLNARRATFFSVLLLSCAARAGELTTGNLIVTNDATIMGNLYFSSTADGTNVGGMATGGTITTNGNYRIHTFTNVGTANFIVSGGPLVCDVLVVAGGGSGVNPGGGAGGVIITNGLMVFGNNIVTVGAGGAEGKNNGEISVFGALTAIGGGYGQDHYGNKSVGSGGSGGGGTDPGRGGAVGSGTPGQGYAGGIGASDQSTWTAFGGGGGAGEPGHAGTSTSAGNGGDGRVCDFSGTLVYYGGGGGGAGDSPNVTRGLGGKGGGGDGVDPSHRIGSAGQANTGGGGGGNGLYVKYYGGGSGIVIVRYLISGYAPSLTISSSGIRQTSTSGVNIFMGKVGIGTESPAEQLQVSGNLRVDGTMSLGGEMRTNWPSAADSLVVSNLQTALGFVVGRSGEAPYPTIQAAIDAASAAGHGLARPVTIEVKPGRYQESLTLRPGIHLKAEIEDGLFSVVVVGNHQYNYTDTAAGDLIISGVAFYSPGTTATDPLFLVAGNRYTSLRLNHCVLQSTDNGPALRLANTGTQGGRLSNTEMFHCRIRGLNAASTAVALVELNSGSFLMDEADIYLADAADRSFRATGISQLLLDNAQVRGRIETANNAYLQLTQSSIDSGAQPCIVHNSATAAIGFEVLFISTLAGNVVSGSGVFLYNNLSYFYSAYGIPQTLPATAFPVLTEGAINLLYRAAAAADWQNLSGSVPGNVNLALDLLASRVAAAPLVENDPQVGANTLNYVPRWDGSALVGGSIYDPGSGTVRIDGALTLGGETRTNWPTMAVGALLSANNLSDVADPAAARSNLGLGSAAINDTADFLGINGGTVNGAVIFNGLVSLGGPLGDIPMGVYTNR